MKTLFIVATPIGNLEDITIRAIKILFSVDYIACEDTRRTGQLLSVIELRIMNNELCIKDLNLKKAKLISYYDEVEYERLPEIIRLLEQDKDVALVSDGGTPLISDPGFKLVRECIKRGIKVESIPGPSSVITALTLSGLPPNSFWFQGYLPATKSKRIKLLEKLKGAFVIQSDRPTLIFFESPHRLKESLEDIKEVFGDIEITISRELTKINEEIFRGLVSSAILHLSNSKGEFVILL
ncbi:MAG: Ribosomal RNA small subunit methyltransferase I [Candidatus Gottesmanbacteria bacterium GW2011_GWC2_39_8]|uniref:Ribosomal RNA small subunit methyltransferase I n=1 Tax=Candidatus Gottesmanbacteria bacterium GW2011_GWC2_39_8 TaxID=1618450 RepID=A0A0G0Q1U6_9BACT|nr:MAG: Ribosomal RNA small subunit methyltransferase I [Candidatus Gottesmanbacteria bacterium GW2011_GWC2_39_8]